MNARQDWNRTRGDGTLPGLAFEFVIARRGGLGHAKGIVRLAFWFGFWVVRRCLGRAPSVARVRSYTCAVRGVGLRDGGRNVIISVCWFGCRRCCGLGRFSLELGRTFAQFRVHRCCCAERAATSERGALRARSDGALSAGWSPGRSLDVRLGVRTQRAFF